MLKQISLLYRARHICSIQRDEFALSKQKSLFHPNQNSLWKQNSLQSQNGEYSEFLSLTAGRSSTKWTIISANLCAIKYIAKTMRTHHEHLNMAWYKWQHFTVTSVWYIANAHTPLSNTDQSTTVIIYLCLNFCLLLFSWIAIHFMVNTSIIVGSMRAQRNEANASRNSMICR